MIDGPRSTSWVDEMIPPPCESFAHGHEAGQHERGSRKIFASNVDEAIETAGDTNVFVVC